MVADITTLIQVMLRSSPHPICLFLAPSKGNGRHGSLPIIQLETTTDKYKPTQPEAKLRMHVCCSLEGHPRHIYQVKGREARSKEREGERYSRPSGGEVAAPGTRVKTPLVYSSSERGENTVQTYIRHVSRRILIFLYSHPFGFVNTTGLLSFL